MRRTLSTNITGATTSRVQVAKSTCRVQLILDLMKSTFSLFLKNSNELARSSDVKTLSDCTYMY